MNNIKILVSCHKRSYVPENDIIKAIQVGATKGRFDKVVYYDDDGENISHLNDRFNELTAQYWAWKNMDADYYGFFHYRRYMSMTHGSAWSGKMSVDSLDDGYISYFGLGEEKIREFIGDNDIIVPKFYVTESNYQNYEGLNNCGHDIADYNYCLDFIRKNYPQYTDAINEYIHSKGAYYLNMYIMKKEIFFEYCEWLFPMLFAFDKQKDYSGLDWYRCRAPGLTAEKLFGIFFAHLRNKNPHLKHKDASIIFVHDTSIIPKSLRSGIKLILRG